MLRYLKDAGDVDYVIVHKLDRLARNRADDVEINRAFDEAGVRLVSTSENIDQTLGGILLHDIMSSIAEFYSRNLANEVIKGMSEKARNGGTNGKAPPDYRDIRSLTARRTNLENQRRRLLQAHYAGAVPLELLKEEQNRMSRELAAIQHELDGYKADARLVRAHLSQALDLLEDCHRMYTAAPDHLKKQLNRVFFERVLVNPDTDEEGRLVLPPTDPGSDSTADAPKNSNNPSAGPGDDSGVDEPRTANISSSEGNLPGASPSPAPVLVHDRASRTRAAASLNPLFDQLTNHELQRTAQQNQPRRDGGGAKPTSTQRKAPAQRGRRSQSSNTNPDHSPHGPGSYKNLVVPPPGFEPGTMCLSGTDEV